MDGAGPHTTTRDEVRVRRDALARFGRDIMVIIVGVLIALAFDNWATARGERRLENDYLARLARDLRADSAMLHDLRRGVVRGEAGARELVRLLDVEETPSDSLIGRYFSDATRGAFIAPNTPTILDLQATGNLRVLRDEGQRDALLTYYARAARLQLGLETVMRRGRDPLAELGWDIQAFDQSIDYAANAERTQTSVTPSMHPADGTLLERFREHPDARRTALRAVTYNALLQPILSDWEFALEQVRQRMP